MWQNAHGILPLSERISMPKIKREFYQVAIKILLKKEDKFLLLKSYDGLWDLPGGRINKGEDKIPLEKILAREVREELGNIKYRLKYPLFQFRRLIASSGLKIFIVVLEAEYISGKIKISAEHKSSAWINPKGFKPKIKDFFCQEEFEAFKKYFERFK